MTQAVKKDFEQQRKINFMLGKKRDIEIDGYKGFIFTAKTGRSLMPSAVNNILYNIVELTIKRKYRPPKKNIAKQNDS